MTLAELVQGKPTHAMSTEDYAIVLREKIDGVTELEAECEQLRVKLDEYQDESEKLERTRKALSDLIDAIEGSRVGKICKVGALVIVEDAGSLGGLGDALAAAKECL